jgi:DNA polymerase III delta prime subunit
MMATIVIYGPPGCGKTRNAEALAKHFQLAQVIDCGLDLHSERRLLTGHLPATGALVLTNLGRPEIEAYVGNTLRLMPFAAAMNDMRRAGGTR